jgi:hypothetical protein
MPRPRAGEAHVVGYDQTLLLPDAPALRRGGSRSRLQAETVNLPGARPGHPPCKATPW